MSTAQWDLLIIASVCRLALVMVHVLGHSICFLSRLATLKTEAQPAKIDGKLRDVTDIVRPG